METEEKEFRCIDPAPLLAIVWEFEQMKDQSPELNQEILAFEKSIKTWHEVWDYLEKPPAPDGRPQDPYAVPTEKTMAFLEKMREKAAALKLIIPLRYHFLFDRRCMNNLKIA